MTAADEQTDTYQLDFNVLRTKILAFNDGMLASGSSALTFGTAFLELVFVTSVTGSFWPQS